MIDLSNESLIKRELQFREEMKGRLRTSIIDTYYLEYEADRQEVIPVRHFDGCVMTKADVETIIKGLTNYLNNRFSEEDIEKFNNEMIRDRERMLYGNDEPKEKTRREALFGSKVQEGVVYFIREKFSGTIKIGKTKNLKSRTKQFGVKLPFEWEYIKVIDSKDYSLTEMLLHKKFESKRTNGEWFSLTNEDINDIINENFEEDVLQSIRGDGDLYGE